MASIVTGHVTHWACLGCSGSAYTTACSSSCQYPATSHSHWRGVDQHSTGHNQQPDQLYAKEMCCTTWGKWWSHQILTGFQYLPWPHKPSDNHRNWILCNTLWIVLKRSKFPPSTSLKLIWKMFWLMTFHCRVLKSCMNLFQEGCTVKKKKKLGKLKILSQPASANL